MKFKSNLFNYATSELSQDAILCYIFKNFYSENKEEKECSINFIKKFIFKDDNIQIKEINNLKNNNDNIKQYSKYGNIDVYLDIEIEKENKKENWLILIEDKTETFLHPRIKKEKNIYGEEIGKEYAGQLDQEINGAINDKEKADHNIMYILFKSKENYEMQYFYNFDFYKAEYEKNPQITRNIEIHRRDVDDFLDALKDVKDNIILQMIKEYYENLKIDEEKTKNLLEKLNYEEVKKLDECLRKTFGFDSKEDDEAIIFFRPGGNSKQPYKTRININKNIKDEIKKHIPYIEEKKELIEKSHWGLDIEWIDSSKIKISIVLNMCEEKDCNYMSYQNLCNRNKEKYERKRKRKIELIDILNTNLAQKNENYCKSKKAKDALDILKYTMECVSSITGNELVKVIIEAVEKVYNDFIKVLKEYVEVN